MMYQDLNLLWQRLQHSAFRAKFHLNNKDSAYLIDKGLELILGHANEFVEQRLAPAHPARDGKQTPWQGHPVFVAQHATATCCRGCLAKWHAIEQGQPLTEQQKQYIINVIGYWLQKQSSQLTKSLSSASPNQQLPLL